MNITLLERARVQITRILQDIILEEAHEPKRNLESQIKEMDLEDHLIRSQASATFWSWNFLCSRCALWSATGSSLTSKLRNLDMQTRVVRMQPNKYFKEAKWLECKCTETQ